MRDFVLTPVLQPEHQGAEHTWHPALQAGYQGALLSDCKFQVIITCHHGLGPILLNHPGLGDQGEQPWRAEGVRAAGLQI